MEKKIFLDETHRVLTGEEAEAALRQRNDAPFLNPDKGVVRVSKERWDAAQRFERDYWLEKSSGCDDDRNHEHYRHFDGYSALRGKTFEDAIELGCGPFTNLRLISQECAIRRCTLLDPLLEQYARHSKRTYDERWLHSKHNRLYRRLGSARPARALRRLLGVVAPGWLRGKTPVRRLLPCPIEEMPLDHTYDLIVLINVIEHCYDLDLIFDNILKIARPNALLVFSDKYYDREKIARWVQGERYDVGHPLLVDRSVLQAFLRGHFESLYERVVACPWVVEGVDFSYDAVYFVGRKLEKAT
jgi:SAM-dependent methyltransferase